MLEEYKESVPESLIFTDKEFYGRLVGALERSAPDEDFVGLTHGYCAKFPNVLESAESVIARAKH